MRRRRASGICALAVGLLTALAGCGSPTAGTAEPAPGDPPATAGAAAATSAAAASPAAVRRCVAGDLSVRLGNRTGDAAAGQYTVPLVFTNTSAKPCELYGVPGVDLVGPRDPNGTTYSLRRPGADAAQQRITLAPRQSAHSVLTYLTDTPGSEGSLGSRNWVPVQVVTTPPGDTHQLVTPWTTGDSVLRQDSATRPGSFVGPIAPGAA